MAKQEAKRMSDPLPVRSAEGKVDVRVDSTAQVLQDEPEKLHPMRKGIRAFFVIGVEEVQELRKKDREPTNCKYQHNSDQHLDDFLLLL